MNTKTIQIIIAAYKHKGKIYSGDSHAQIRQYYTQRHEDNLQGSQPGFLTSEGDFVDRIVAMHIALKARQIHKPKHPHFGLISDEIHWLNREKLTINQMSATENPASERGL